MSTLELIAGRLTPYIKDDSQIESPEERAEIIALLNGYFGNFNKLPVISLDDITFKHATMGLGNIAVLNK